MYRMSFLLRSDTEVNTPRASTSNPFRRSFPGATSRSCDRRWNRSMSLGVVATQDFGSAKTGVQFREVRTDRLFQDCERAPVMVRRRGRLAQGVFDLDEVAQRRGHVGMIGPEPALLDFE